MDILKNQSEIFLHLTLWEQDIAYRWSVINDSISNMQLVLKAHGEPYNWESAEKQLEVAKTLV